MTTSSFWNFISAAEDEYSVYRKRIMAKFSLSAAETDIICLLYTSDAADESLLSHTAKRNKAILRLFCLTDLPMKKSPHLKDTILK